MIENLSVWSLPIDWTDGVTETLEFLTTVGESPSAVEQRRGLRLTPRQYFEYQYILKGSERTYFDLLTMRSGGSPCYLPVWHDVEVLQYDHPAGSLALSINTTYTEFMNSDAVFIGGTYDYELVEIAERTETSITLVDALLNDWPAGTRVCPLKKVKLDQQPSTTRKTESIHVARVKFCSIEPNRTDAGPPLNMFGLQYVLETDPNEVDDLTYNYERVISTLDNTTGIPAMSDVTGRVLQQFAWWCKGRQAHHQLRGLFYSLDGRRVPVWVPTIYEDFELVLPLAADQLWLDVKRNGFTDLGGPGPQREYLLIQLLNGTRFYRKIVGSINLGDGKTERIILDEALGQAVSLAEVNRISFLVLCRLDQDTVELIHHTATRGMTTVVAVFRSAAAKPGIENIIEVPPGITPAVICLSDFLWYQGSPPIAALRQFPQRVDSYGNFYDPIGGGFSGVNNGYNIYNTNGVLLRTYYVGDLGDMIDAWHGSPIFGTNSSYYSMAVSPIRQGRYVLVFLNCARVGYAFDKWWALCEPATDGSLTIKGAVFYRILTGPPYAQEPTILETYSDDDCLLFQAWYALGAWTATIGVLPSINQFLAGTYTSGWPGLLPCQVPTTLLYPIGNVYDLTYRLFLQTAEADTTSTFGFKLPGNGRDVYYIYIDRDNMQFQLSSATTLYNLELRNVIGPSYPYGVMLKIGLGDISDFAAIATPVINGPWHGRATDTYTIDNSNWLDTDDGVAIPFLDEYTYISDGTVGGSDHYSTIVNTKLRWNGNHWVVFIMVGVEDSFNRAVSPHVWASPVYAKVRLFEYYPASEVAQQWGEHVCILHTNEDIPNTSGFPGHTVMQNNKFVFADITETEDSVIITIYGRLYKTSFCQFSLLEV